MYTIYAGDICIFDDTSPALEHQLINPKLQLSAGAAGSLTITVPKTNAGYSAISRLTTTIKVKRDGAEIWRGRVLTESKDLWNNRVLFCEGCLAFLNDSIQSSSTAVTGQVPAYVSALLTNHNAKVASNRQISLGTVSVEDPAGSISRYLNGETTLALLQKLVNELGGVLRTRFSGETILLDYLKEYPSSGSYALSMGTLEAGGIRYNTGATYSSTTIYRNPANIPLGNYPSGSKLKYSRIHTTATSANTVHGIAFYNSEGTYISGVKSGTGASATHYEDYETTIPNGAAYVRLSLLNPANYSGAFASVKWEGGAAAQSIDLEENLLDFTRDWDNTDFCTVVLPRGARQDSEDSNLQRYLDISGCTEPTGYSILDSVYLSKTASASAYGRIERVIDFSDIGQSLNDEASALDAADAELAGLYERAEALEAKTEELYDQLQDLDPDSSEYDRVNDRYQATLSEYQAAQAAYSAALTTYNAAYNTYTGNITAEKAKLILAAQEYLSDRQYDDMSLELTALDLHITDRAVPAWNLLDVVQVHARPYFGAAGKTFAILGMSIPLDAPEKTKYTLGAATIPKKRRVLSLTKQQARTAAELAESVEAARSAGQDYTNGIKTTLEAQEAQIVARVEDAEGDMAQIIIDVDGIESRVTNAEGDISTVSHTADEIRGKVAEPIIDPQTGDVTGYNWTVANLKSDGLYVYGSGSSATRTLITGSMIDVDTIHANKLYGGTIYFMINTGTDPQTGEPVFAQVGTFIFNETQVPGVYQIGFGQFAAVDFGGVTDVYVHDPDTIYFSSLGKSLQDLLDEKADV